MKSIFAALLLFALTSCKKEEKKNTLYPETETAQTPVQLGEEIFNGKGNCYSCHKPDQKIIGPSIREISKIYKEKNGSIVSFLKEESQPIVDPAQYETMKTNFAVTKNLPENELKALEAYIHSQPE